MVDVVDAEREPFVEGAVTSFLVGLNGVGVAERRGPRPLFLHVGAAHQLGPEAETSLFGVGESALQVGERGCAVELIRIEDNGALAVVFRHHLVGERIDRALCPRMLGVDEHRDSRREGTPADRVDPPAHALETLLLLGGGRFAAMDLGQKLARCDAARFENGKWNGGPVSFGLLDGAQVSRMVSSKPSSESSPSTE